MIWVIVIVGIGVLGLAALAASGKLGSMPPPVNSRPVGRLPEGELTNESFSHVRFRMAKAGSGYAPAEVDKLLDKAVAGSLTPDDLTDLELPISTKAAGYAFDEVDHVVEQLRLHLTDPKADGDAEPGATGEEPVVAGDVACEDPAESSADGGVELEPWTEEGWSRSGTPGEGAQAPDAALVSVDEPAEYAYEQIINEPAIAPVEEIEVAPEPHSEPDADAEQPKSAE